MTLEQIQKLYPKAQPYQPKDEVERKAMQASDESALKIPSIDLVRTPFEVIFMWKGPSKEIAAMNQWTYTKEPQSVRKMLSYLCENDRIHQGPDRPAV